MHLLDYVCLIESEVLALHTASTFKHSITKLASYKHSDSWKKLCNNYDRKPSLEGNWKKIADFFGETHFKVKVESPNPSQWNTSVEYSQSRAAGYPKIG